VTKGSKTALSEEAQGRLFLTLYLSQFAQGFAHTFVYMLRDDPVQGDWGFINTNYSMKPSGEYMHRLTSVLDDDGHQPGVSSNDSDVSNPARTHTLMGAAAATLDYTITNRPETVHDLLMVKSSGEFALAVWSERANDDTDSVTVVFGETHADVSVYDPTVSAAPAQTLHDVRSVTLHFTGFHAQVILLK
jgi:hypothetical protein